MPRTSLLILSFSPIASDARVLKQVRLFAERYDVTTCGFGPAPTGPGLDGVRHVEIPAEHASLALDGRLITLRAYPLVERRTPAVVGATRALADAGLGRGTFDVILANDVESVPLALRLRPRLGVHADLHELSTRLHDESPAWTRRIAPYQRWLARRFVSRARSVTTVSEGLVRGYAEDARLKASVVVNATPFADLEPTTVADDAPLRLVHSGAGLANRHLEILVEAVALTRNRVTLDLFLTANDPAYLARLRMLAADIPGVTLRDPVPYEDLVATLAGFDVGVFVLPPVNASYARALPNKLFDFVQARLGIVVSPNDEMAALVRQHGLGAVTAGYTARDLADTLDALTAADVREWKQAAHAAAGPLSAEQQTAGWVRAVDAIAARAAGGAR
ncbi:glycosyltransferase family 1 protein [Flavimobilis sp. GY10621]|uniref:Glycosyltransferase family 1 protein n=1 Tax=Flavimobilis rhizosphaerae TaxID=2775421 RepID=A0ABR9DMH2_9MICO|nr:glycosyltransferase [Flavimobilis rhizosphaerae]MBD9698326.1 glycosyltransferase family 1 protein [Flavimobilis rhizosphaerae]